MRFFSGIRDKASKKGSASDLFRQNMNKKEGPPLTNDEKYKKIVEARMEKMRAEYMAGNKPGFKLPGTKQDDKPKEMSKRTKEMLELLAMQKAKKDMKKEKKKLDEWKRAQKAEKNAKLKAENAKLLLQQTKLQNEKYEAERQAAVRTDDKEGWW